MELSGAEHGNVKCRDKISRFKVLLSNKQSCEAAKLFNTIIIMPKPHNRPQSR